MTETTEAKKGPVRKDSVFVGVSVPNWMEAAIRTFMAEENEPRLSRAIQKLIGEALSARPSESFREFRNKFRAANES